MGRTAGAQIDLDRLIASLTASATPIPPDIIAHQGELAGLLRDIAMAGPKELSGLQKAVAMAVASATSAVQALAGASASAGMDAAERAKVARQTIEAIGHDLFDRHVLDDHLQFDSKEDEEAYRKRERENRIAYEREKAKGTAKGDVRAKEILQAQLDDAKAHGADRSPQFATLQAQLDQASADLAPAPTDTAKRPERTSAPGAHAQTPTTELDDVMAALKAAGVETGSSAHPATGHGLAAATPATAPVQSGRT